MEKFDYKKRKIKRKINILILIIAVPLSVFFITNISFAVNDSEILISNLENDSGTVYSQQEREFIDHILNYNLDYLGLAITIVLAGAIFVSIGFYFFNFKPLQKKLDEQEKKVEELRKKNEESFSNLIQNQDKRFKGLEAIIEGKINTMTLELWNRLDESEAKAESKIKQLETQIKSELSDEIEKSEKTISLLEEQKARLDKQEESLNAEISRSMALHSEEFKDNKLMFYWWIKSAYHFYKLDENDYIILGYIKRAKGGLEKLITGDIEWLKNTLPEMEEWIKELRDKHPEEVRRLEALLVKKLDDLRQKPEQNK